MCDFLVFLLKADVLVHNFWILYTEVNMADILGICRLFPLIIKQNCVFSIYKKEGNFDPSGKLI